MKLPKIVSKIISRARASPLSCVIHPVWKILSHLRCLLHHPNTVFAFPVQAVACSFSDHVKVFGGAKLSRVRVGRCSYIGGDTVIKNANIGKFCSIGPEVRIGLGAHSVKDVVSTYPGFYSNSASGVKGYYVDQSIWEHLPITIGNDVWIGQRSLILDGVRVGNGAVIGAGSVVTKDVADYAVVAGVPAKLIRFRASEADRQLLTSIAWWDWSDEKISTAAKDMQNLQLFLSRWGGEK